MVKFFVIAAGGAIGSLARYLISGLDYSFFRGSFPLGTFIINLTGSFLIGFFWAFFERFSISPLVRIFFFIGILGGYSGFTTGLALYINTDGTLTHTAPETGTLQQVGFAVSPSEIFLFMQQPIRRA